MNFKRNLFWTLLSGCIIIQLTLFYQATKLGIGVTPDSVSYFWGAQGILSGNGYSYPDFGAVWVPIVHWPPVYSLVLSVTHLIIQDITKGAWILNAVLLVCSAVLFTKFIYEKLYLNKTVLVWTIILYITSPSVLPVYTMAWTEPLYINLTLLSFLLLLKFSEFPQQKKYLISAAILAGISSLARYVGIATIIAGFLFLLINTKKRSEKNATTKMYAFFSLPFYIIWLIRDYIISNQVLGRTPDLYLYPIKPIKRIQDFLAVVGSWFAGVMPEGASGVDGVYALLGIVVVFVLIVKLLSLQLTSSVVTKNLSLAILYTISFLFVYVYSDLALNKIAQFDFRVLSPLYPYFLFTLTVLLAEYVNRVRKSRSLYLLYSLLSVHILFSLYRTVNWVTMARITGLGANSLVSSQLVKTINDNYSDRIIYSNRSKIAYYLFDQPSLELPAKQDYQKTKTVKYDAKNFYLVMKDNFKNHDAIFVIFKETELSENYYSEDFIISDLGLKKIIEDETFRIYE